MQDFRIDLFTNPHKDLRKQMFELSLMSAHAELDNEEYLASVEYTTRSMIFNMRKHARSEDTYALPIIAYKLPEQKDIFDHEHVEHERELHNLELRLQTLRARKTSPAQQAKIMTEFYRAINRFIASHLLHLDKEEYLMQNLWEVCTNMELFAIMIAYKSNEEPENFAQFKHLALQFLSADEIEEMLFIINERLGEKIYTISHDAWSQQVTI